MDRIAAPAEARTAALRHGDPRRAADHGLDPDWYGIGRLEKAVADGRRPRHRDAADRGLRRLCQRRLDRPGQRQPHRQGHRHPAAQGRARRSPEGRRRGARLRGLARRLPPKGDYPALQKALAAWRDKRATAATRQLPDGNRAEARHDRRARADPAQAPGRARPHGAGPAADAAPELYDEPLVAVVKPYQETKGLTVDGVIGAKTRHARSTPRSTSASSRSSPTSSAGAGCRRISAAATCSSTPATTRWCSSTAGKVAFHSQVIVGTPKDPTPEIQSTHARLPDQSLLDRAAVDRRRGIPADAAARSLRAADGGFKIFATGASDTELDPATVDWSAINPKAFPYRIRQEPGAGNALGYIFFPFQNKYGIYMHDTATRWLFTEGSRNFSHGCIRLQNPLDFVEKVFKASNGFNKDARAAGDRCRPAGALRLPRADHALRHLPDGVRRRGRQASSATTSTAATARSSPPWRRALRGRRPSRAQRGLRQPSCARDTAAVLRRAASPSIPGA